MSKNKLQFGKDNSPSSGSVWEAEYAVIHKDISRIVLINAIFLAGILVLYFTNQDHHYLEQWFGKIFNW